MIISQIEQVEAELARYESLLDAIERKLRLADLTEEKWKTLQEEKAALEKQIAEAHKKLKSLRWENWKSMLVSVILLGAGYLIFVMFYGSSPPQTSS